MITPREFVERWSQSTLREQQAAQSHFNELCELVGHKTPAQLDPAGEFFAFEEQVTKATGGKGRADVWYRGHFAWEYKGKHKDLNAAYAQLLAYRSDLGNPPLLVVCDFLEYRIYPQWVNTSGLPFVFKNEDLLHANTRRFFTWLLESPERFLELRQTELEQREKITLELAEQFAELADLMRDYKDVATNTPLWTPMQIARFLTKLVFALFAEDIELMPRLFKQPVFRFLVDGARKTPAEFSTELQRLFEAMDGVRAAYILQPVPYFNGGLFAASQPGADDAYAALDLTLLPGGIDLLEKVSEADWRFVNPTIFGTLFEGALDKNKRAQLGAHYTSETDIRLVIEPVLMQPLYRQWDAIRAEAEPLLQTYLTDTAPKTRETARQRLQTLHDTMMMALEKTTVLDPACGSGNFLYMSLRTLKDLEGRVRKFFEPMNLSFRDVVTPRQLYGIEKDEFAANLARVVVWIGYLQWRYEDEGILHPQLSQKISHPRALPHPICQDKYTPDEPDHILNADAILRYDAAGKPYEPDWQPVDVIVGNPPFLGDKKMRGEFEDHYIDDLRELYGHRIPGQSDLVCYWFEKARTQLEHQKVQRTGFLATNSIRGGANRTVLERIKQTGDIFLAWSDRAWVLAGASVRISIIGFDDGSQTDRYLDDISAHTINADLTPSVDLTQARVLRENPHISFIGVQPGGAFDLPESEAQDFIQKNRKNADVLRPYYNAADVTGRWSHRWIIDFWDADTPEEAAKYPEVFQIVVEKIKPEREKNRDRASRETWWKHQRPRYEMRDALNGLNRYLVTPMTAKYRLFTWMDKNALASNLLVVIAVEDDYFFGVLHSYLHEVWSLRRGSWLGKGNDPRYTPSTIFETFPFPASPGKEKHDSAEYQAIAAAAQQLHEERELWLNPPELIALGAEADGKTLRERTLTNLYNAFMAQRTGQTNGERLTAAARDFAPRLVHLHDTLDNAVLAAYGWQDLAASLRTLEGDEELLRRLLVLNLERAQAAP
jgi:hypothetical protein